VNDATRRRIRTTFQTVVAAAPVLLVVVPAVMKYAEVALPPKAYGILAAGAAIVVAVASYVTKIMSNPVVAAFIERRLPWLAATDPAGEPTALDDLADAGPRDELTPTDG